jgi:hypothetical protein
MASSVKGWELAGSLPSLAMPLAFKMIYDPINDF